LLFISLWIQSGNFWIHPRMHLLRSSRMAPCKLRSKIIPGTS